MRVQSKNIESRTGNLEFRSSSSSSIHDQDLFSLVSPADIIDANVLCERIDVVGNVHRHIVSDLSGLFVLFVDRVAIGEMSSFLNSRSRQGIRVGLTKVAEQD